MERQPLKLSTKGHQIKKVETGSIAWELEIQANSYLLSIDEVAVIDVFDYRMRELAADLTVRILTPEGELCDYEIEKDEGEPLGLVFENPMLSACTHCHNKCVFCFIDQLPKGMRETLYFKDDDLRLSFLTGNYVTLTNLTEKEFERLIAYKFSPLNISVHATEPLVRQRMMGHPKAGFLMERLRRLVDAGIRLNTQIVLCPGYNDGKHLERTLGDLISLGENLQSVAIVPVGVTRFRDENNLAKMRAVSHFEATEVAMLVASTQQMLLEQYGRRIVFAADEFYLKAGLPLPSEETYEGYPQLENGVGMATLFETDMQRIDKHSFRHLQANFRELALPERFSPQSQTTPTVCIMTGVLAAPILHKHQRKFFGLAELSGEVISVRNDFFGHDITVAGLLTAGDLVKAYASWKNERLDQEQHIVVIPECMLRQGETVLLDNVTIDEMARQINAPVVVVDEDAKGLLAGLKWIRHKMCTPSRRGSEI